MLRGRDLVLASIDACLDSALRSAGRLVVLQGEAGIGKTSVARWVAERGRGAGATVRWGACWESDAVPPFGVWLDALRRPGSDACQGVVDRLEQGDLDLVAAAVADAAAAERARARFFTEVLDALRVASASVPQVVVLEDLHWADRGSVEMLRALAGYVPSMALLVVVTYRDDELEGGDPFAGIGGGVEVIGLEGLDEAAVAGLLGEILGGSMSPTEAREVHDRTGGNPLFVTQIGRLMATGSRARVPAGVREVLARRFSRVSAACDRVLGVAAVAGTEFRTSLVAGVLGVAEESVLDGLDQAAEARLVQPVDGDRRRWAFNHDLIRSARYEALGSGERAHHHCRFAEELDRLGAPSGLIAHHAVRGSFEHGDPRPSRFAVVAARDALERFAWDDAASLCRRALDLAPPGAEGDGARAEAWLALGDALTRTHDAAGTRMAFAAAAAIGREAGDAELVARAALGFGAGLGGFEVRVLDHGQIDLLEEATGALPPGSSLRPLVLARLSVALSFVGSQVRRLGLAEEAVEVARERGDGASLAAGLAARCDARAGPDHVDERLAAATEIVELARQSGDIGIELLGRRLRLVALLERRDLVGFDAEVAAFSFSADRTADPLYLCFPPLWHGMRAYADGRIEEAERLVDQARKLAIAGGSSNVRLLTVVFDACVAMDRRNAEAIDPVWEEAIASFPGIAHPDAAPTALWSLARARVGNVDGARALLARAGPGFVDRVPKDQEWLATMTELLAVGILTGQEAHVRRAYELLLPYEGLGVFEGVAAFDNGGVDRFLAWAAGHLGDREATRAHVYRALARGEGSGRLVLAHTQADCARGLLASTDDGDQRWGRQLAEAARGEYEDVGLHMLADELAPGGTVDSSTGGTGSAGGAATDGLVATAATPDSRRPGLARDGEMWAFTFEGATVRVHDSKGVADLAILLARPGTDVHVRAIAGVDRFDLPSSQQAALDQTALDQYRRRLRDLEEDLEEAETGADLVRAERIAAERDAIVDELTAALGIGGRARGAASDPDERLRKAVSARVKATMGKLEKVHPALGRHLRNSIRTGFWCSYRPESDVSWDVSTSRRQA